MRIKSRREELCGVIIVGSLINCVIWVVEHKSFIFFDKLLLVILQFRSPRIITLFDIEYTLSIVSTRTLKYDIGALGFR